MEVRAQGRLRPMLAIGAMLAFSTPAWAQPMPGSFPLADPSDDAIEIYYGTAKVAPRAPVVRSRAPVVAAPAVIPAAAVEPAKPHSAEAFVEAMHSVRDGTRDVSAAAVGFLGKVGERMKHSLPSRQIVLASYAAPSVSVPPAPLPAVSAPVQPQLVVVHEPAAQPPYESRGVTLSFEMLAACGIGLLGLVVAALAWSRGPRRLPETAFPSIPTAVPLDSGGVQLMGKYNAGPMPESAEKFELGPSYREAQQQKKQIEAAHNSAAVEFVLNQNLELLAALNPDAAGAMIQTESEGSAAPALA